MELAQEVVDWAQVIGAALSLVALVVALFALWKSGRDIHAERKVQHDLEILREMGRPVALAPEDHAMRAYRLLSLLYNAGGLSLSRAALGVRPTPECERAFAGDYPDAAPLPDMATDYDTLRSALWSRFKPLHESGVYIKEVFGEISRRLS